MEMSLDTRTTKPAKLHWKFQVILSTPVARHSAPAIITLACIMMWYYYGGKLQYRDHKYNYYNSNTNVGTLFTYFNKIDNNYQYNTSTVAIFVIQMQTIILIADVNVMRL